MAAPPRRLVDAAGQPYDHCWNSRLLRQLDHCANGRNVGDRDVLADLAAEVGLDRTEAVASLDSGQFAEAVRAFGTYLRRIWMLQCDGGWPAVLPLHGSYSKD